MASIAYITDKKMIEFHRLNGNQTMNFWRLSSHRKFTYFYPGDYLFFLAKGTEHRTTKEKGIIGYGKFDFSKIMSLTQMWNQYGELNGFSSKEEFKEAVLKISKTKTIPKSMHGLMLKDIIFFKYPIYLSEIGVSISNNLESYIYLDKFGVSATVRLLKKAQDIGIDSWQAAIDEHINQEIFENDLQNHMLADCVTRVFISDVVSKTLKKYLERYQDTFEYVKGSKAAIFNNQTYEIVFALDSKERQKEEAFYSLLGKILSTKSMIEQISEINSINYRYSIVTDQTIDYEKRVLLDSFKINLVSV